MFTIFFLTLSPILTAQRFALLHKARNILTDAEKRKVYDTFRRSHGGMSYDQWIQNHLEHVSIFVNYLLHIDS